MDFPYGTVYYAVRNKSELCLISLYSLDYIWMCLSVFLDMKY